MISTAEALDRIFALASPLDTEHVPLTHATGRVLAADMVATRAQPPFAASAMDGYAIQSADLHPGASLKVIGEAPAGQVFEGRVNAGEAVRIFTGGPVPEGADYVVIQEDTSRTSTGITLNESLGTGTNIRSSGGDFVPGDRLTAPRRLRPSDVALAASMNLPTVEVRRKPIVSLIATGNELVQPGEQPRDDQIIASNALGLKGLLEASGAEARLLPIARDTVESLRTVFDLSQGSDLVVTIGGASVGDHDLVEQVAVDLGMERAFYKVAMRPGKPLMAGRLGDTPMIGLPGNPVSSMVCGHIFILPLLRRMLGFAAEPARRRKAVLASDLSSNGPREHYMRARLVDGAISAFDRQDSSLLMVLSQANALLVRPPHDPERSAGDTVDYVPLDID